MAQSVECVGEDLVIRFIDSTECTLLKQSRTIKALTEFVLDFFQENLRVRLEVPGSDGCTPDANNGLAPLQERRALANDPLVLTALDVFTGQIGEIRVGQRYRTGAPETRGQADEEEQTAADD